MNWLIWRLYRKQLFIFTGLLVVFAAVAIPSGLHFWHEYQHLIAGCAQKCNETDLRNTIFKTDLDGLVVNFVKLALLGLPFLLGLFVGVPLLAKEYAEKTNKLVWTQGISRKKWLTSKLVWVLLVTIIYAGIFSAVAAWFSKTGDAISHDRFGSLAFSSQGLVPVAATVFAVSVGAMFGAWFKKVLPALGATLALLLLVQIAVPVLARPHYVAPASHTTTSLLGDNKGGDPLRNLLQDNQGAWMVGEKMISKNGQVFDWSNPPSSCKVAEPGMGPKQQAPKGDNPDAGDPEKRHGVMGRNNVFVDVDCLNSLGYHWEIKYQPSYRYWNFQRIETGLYVSLSLLAVGVTYAFVTRRDA
jgi:ABC-type transport system involved in multi-copper enzyme maturation permease subunit